MPRAANVFRTAQPLRRLVGVDPLLQLRRELAVVL
jgi:hypothetical protein